MSTHDNRLDYICSFKPGATAKMEGLREMYKFLDDQLREIESKNELEGCAMRTLALARTNLEASLMYAIKTLCLANENKDCD